MEITDREFEDALKKQYNRGIRDGESNIRFDSEQAAKTIDGLSTALNEAADKISSLNQLNRNLAAKVSALESEVASLLAALDPGDSRGKIRPSGPGLKGAKLRATGAGAVPAPADVYNPETGLWGPAADMLETAQGGAQAEAGPEGAQDGAQAQEGAQGAQGGAQAEAGPEGAQDGAQAQEGAQGAQDGAQAEAGPEGAQDGAQAQDSKRWAPNYNEQTGKWE